jgi:predicted nucleic acid-binding protein
VVDGEVGVLLSADYRDTPVMNAIGVRWLAVAEVGVAIAPGVLLGAAQTSSRLRYTGLASRSEIAKRVSETSRRPVYAVSPNGAQAIADARNLLRNLDTVVLTRQLLDNAGTLQPLDLRSLDAIHLVAAQRAGDTLRAVVTYDARMISAAADLGIVTASPR